MKAINFIALILILLGAINWGLLGLFQFDLVTWLFAGMPEWFFRLIYTILGLSGVWGLTFLCKCRAICCYGPCCKKKDEK